jgi:hypothetical protein
MATGSVPRDQLTNKVKGTEKPSIRDKTLDTKTLHYRVQSVA